MKYIEYLRKAIILLKEAKSDLKIGNFNKAVSAMWFALEAIMRGILIFSGKQVPAKSGALMSKFVKFIVNLGANATIKDLLNSIYFVRMNADHKARIIDKRCAERTWNKTKKVLEELKHIMEMLGMNTSELKASGKDDFNY